MEVPSQPITIDSINSTAAALENKRTGLALSALIMGAAESINHNDLSRQRLVNSAISIINLDNFEQISFADIAQNCQLYGLEPTDLCTIEAWKSKLTNYETIFEPQYGTMRADAFRKIIANEFLSTGITGTLGEADLVGLKGFNNYGREYGDQAIAKSVELWKQILHHIYPNTSCSIGRDGDEIYFFVPGKTETNVNQLIQEYFLEHAEEIRASTEIVITNSDGGKNKKHAVTYWQVGDVNFDNFDQKRLELDSQIESIKVKKTLEIVRFLKGDNDAIKMLVNYLIKEKRIPEDVVHAFVSEITRSSVDPDNLIEDSNNSQISDMVRAVVEEIIPQ